MKKILFILSLLCVFCISAWSQAYTYIEHNVRRESKTYIPTATLYHEQSFGNSSWGYTDYIYVTTGWGEVLPGLYYKPSEKTMFAGYVGMESVAPYWRFGAYVSHKLTDRLKASVFAEHGKGTGNYWYDAQVWWESISRQSWSLYVVPRARRENGLGAQISFQKKQLFGIPNWSGYLSFAPFYHVEEAIWKPTLFVAVEF